MGAVRLLHLHLVQLLSPCLSSPISLSFLPLLAW